MKTSTRKMLQDVALPQSPQLGNYAHSLLKEHYRNTVKHEKQVLADQDPEHLHHMRVGTRRLRTALQVFGRVVQLPKEINPKRIGKVAKTLGNLRDLDVQIDNLQTIYRPALAGKEQKVLDEIIMALEKKRQDAFAAVEHDLQRSRYRTLKETYENWLDQPAYSALAELPLIPLLPDLLSPLLAELLLHPGWLVPEHHAAELTPTLHDLRKTLKHVRYQTEFFVPFYGESFQQWIKDIKVLQEQLGQLQDSQVLTHLLAEYLPKKASLPTLQTAIQETRAAALENWNVIRQKYLAPEFRNQLHLMLLEPSGGLS
jgi:CHAD domain-containing protein